MLEKIYLEIIKKTKKFNDKKNITMNMRQANELKEAVLYLTYALEVNTEEILAEHLRQANRSLERIIGNIDIEEVLGNIFSSFCIGK